MLIIMAPMWTKSCDATSRMNKQSRVRDKVPQDKNSPIVTNTLVTTIASVKDRRKKIYPYFLKSYSDFYSLV